jgi:hypothetical protein
MDELAKTVFIGKWRSFKLFKHNGNIKFNSADDFKEFHFNSDDMLTIKEHKGGQSQQLAHTNQWTMEFKDRYYYLKLPLYKMIFEVITVNHTVLVLRDMADSEKIFLCKDLHWNTYLQSNKEFNL